MDANSIGLRLLSAIIKCISKIFSCCSSQSVDEGNINLEALKDNITSVINSENLHSMVNNAAISQNPIETAVNVIDGALLVAQDAVQNVIHVSHIDQLQSINVSRPNVGSDVLCLQQVIEDSVINVEFDSRNAVFDRSNIVDKANDVEIISSIKPNSSASSLFNLIDFYQNSMKGFSMVSGLMMMVEYLALDIDRCALARNLDALNFFCDNTTINYLNPILTESRLKSRE